MYLTMASVFCCSASRFQNNGRIIVLFPATLKCLYPLTVAPHFMGHVQSCWILNQAIMM